MKNIQAMYAHLQQTSWKDFATTTLGNLPADKYNQIEEAYAKQIALENGQSEAPPTPEKTDVEIPTGDSMNSAGGAAPSESSQPNTETKIVTPDVFPSHGNEAQSDGAPISSEGNFGENDANELTIEPSTVDEAAKSAVSDVAAEPVVIEGEKGQA